MMMMILALVATKGCNCGAEGSGETDGFGTTDEFTSTAGPMTETDAMTSTMTAGMTDAMSSTMTAGMTAGMTEGDDAMNTTSGPADSTGSTPSACIESGQYIASLTGIDDPFGHLPFLQLFYSADAPETPVDEIFVIDIADDGTVTLDILPRDSDGSSHSGISGIEGTISEICDVEFESLVELDTAEGSFSDVGFSAEGHWEEYQEVQVPTADITLSGGSIPNGPITFNVELAPR